MASCLTFETGPVSRSERSQASPAGAQMVAREWRSLEEPEQIARWDDLTERAGEPNPFHESWCLLPALRTLDPGNRVKVMCLEAEGRLAGLVPITRKSDYYGHRVPHWRGWLHPNAFLGTPLVARGFETIFWLALLAWCDLNAGLGLFFHVAQMPVEGPMHTALLAALRQSPRPAATVLSEERAMLRSSLSPEEYLEQSLSAKKRKELRRQHRRLAELGELTTVRSTAVEDLDRWTAEFLDLERSGWKGEAGSALACDPSTASLFRLTLRGAAERGRLDRLTIRLDDRPVAMLASLVSPPGIFSFKTTFAEDLASFSPGVLLQRENLRLLEREGIAWCDSCASAGHPMIDHFWRERRTIASHSIGIGGRARRALFGRMAAFETGAPVKGLA